MLLPPSPCITCVQSLALPQCLCIAAAAAAAALPGLQVAELEQMLDRKIGQLQILEQKNSELKQRERALQTAIGSRTGALLASKSLLESSLSGGGGGNASPSDSASTASGNCLCALPTACAAAQVRDDGRQQSQSFSNVSAAGSVLSELQEREDEVQRMLDKVGGQELGCTGGRYANRMGVPFQPLTGLCETETRKGEGKKGEGGRDGVCAMFGRRPCCTWVMQAWQTGRRLPDALPLPQYTPVCTHRECKLGQVILHPIPLFQRAHTGRCTCLCKSACTSSCR